MPAAWLCTASFCIIIISSVLKIISGDRNIKCERSTTWVEIIAALIAHAFCQYQQLQALCACSYSCIVIFLSQQHPATVTGISLKP